MMRDIYGRDTREPRHHAPNVRKRPVCPRFPKLFATNHSPQSGAASLRELLCCLPQIAAPIELNYRNVFRVLIVQFIDAHAFDVRSVKKTCIHIVHPDGRLIPFDTYNLFYRDDLERTRLASLRRQDYAKGAAAN